MPTARPVVSSDGEGYASIKEATRCMCLQTASAIHTAVQATSVGHYRTAAGVQWAYAEEKPEIWPVKPAKPPKLPREPRPPVIRPDAPPLKPIFPPEFDKEVWRPIPGLEGYEISTMCYVCDVRSVSSGNVPILLEDQYHGEVSRVEIDGFLYKCVDLMLLAFIGPKPISYVVQKLNGTSERLSNVFYGPRKPRNSSIEDCNAP